MRWGLSGRRQITFPFDAKVRANGPKKAEGGAVFGTNDLKLVGCWLWEDQVTAAAILSSGKFYWSWWIRMLLLSLAAVGGWSLAGSWS